MEKMSVLLWVNYPENSSPVEFAFYWIVLKFYWFVTEIQGRPYTTQAMPVPTGLKEVSMAPCLSISARRQFQNQTDFDIK